MCRKIIAILVLALVVGMPATQAVACPENKTRCGTNLCC